MTGCTPWQQLRTATARRKAADPKLSSRELAPESPTTTTTATTTTTTATTAAATTATTAATTRVNKKVSGTFTVAEGLSLVV